MPELMIDFITSLDGYGAAEGWPGWWGLEGPEYLAWLGDQPEASYTVLMGANTYRLMSTLATEGSPVRMCSPASRRSSFDHIEGAAFVAEHAARRPRPCRGRPRAEGEGTGRCAPSAA